MVGRGTHGDRGILAYNWVLWQSSWSGSRVPWKEHDPWARPQTPNSRTWELPKSEENKIGVGWPMILAKHRGE